VVSLTGELARWETELDGVVAGGGANLAQVCRAARRGGLSGLDSIGSDGHSIGGLVRSAADGIIALGGVLDWVELQRPGAQIGRWRASDSQSVPRPEDLQRRVITRVRFQLRASGMADIKLGTTISSRSRSIRSTGPVFLDSRDATAADLLAEAGCETAAVGGVRLGGDRGNELIAGRSATAADVLELCRMARQRVVAATDIALIPALVFVDELGRTIEL
jgi:UDP-N-acetylenolpyruvoylglucosamine reductase